MGKIKYKKIKVFLLICVIIMPIILTSCWDKIEINERAFVNTIYIEKNPKDKPSDVMSSTLYNKNNEDLVVTFGMVNTAEGEKGLKVYTHTVTAVTLGDATEKLNSSIARTPFFGQTRLVVFGREILEEPKLFRLIMDDLERNTSIDRDVQIAMVENKSVTLDDLKVESEQLYSSYIEGVMKKDNALASTLGINLGKFLNDLRETEGRTMVPIIRKESNNIKVDQVALIDKFKTNQIIEPRQIRSYKLFTAQNTRIRQYIQLNDVLTTFRLSSIDRNVSYVKGGDYPKYYITYNIVGGVEDYDFNKMIFKMKNQLDIERISADTINSQLLELTNYFQKEIGIDYLGLGEWTKKFHPKEYKRYTDWNKAFQNAEIKFDIHVNLLRYGDSK